MFVWQLEEYLGLPYLLAKVGRANTARYAGVEEKVVFGEHPQQNSLIFLPVSTASQRDSIIYFVHGGGWQMGNPALFRFIGRFFAKQGFPTIMAGYRQTPNYQYPAQLADTCASFRVGMTYLANHNVRVRHILLCGQSSGAQLIGLLAYKKEIEIPERPLFTGLIAISGPLDFSVCRSWAIRQLLKAYIGHLPNPEIADPINYARSNVPIPVLCIHGGKDPLVDIDNSKSFITKLNTGGAHRAKIYILHKGHHSDLVNLFLEHSVGTQFLLNWIEEAIR
jgi:acetyl esterase/lipase